MRVIWKKISAFIAAMILTMTSLYMFTNVVDADTVPDDPNDGIITATERKTDLLNEVHEDAPVISAASYILYDADSGSILLGNDYNVQKEPASMTKVMTVLLALERLNLDDIITISPEMAEAVNAITSDIGIFKSIAILDISVNISPNVIDTFAFSSSVKAPLFSSNTVCNFVPKTPISPIIFRIIENGPNSL